MAANVLITLPSVGEVLEPAVSGKFVGAIVKRFRRIVYGSIITIVLVGVPLTLSNENYVDLLQTSNTWSLLILVKHLVVIAMIILAIYSFEVLSPKIAKLTSKGPSPELLKARKLQQRLAATGFVLGIVVLSLIAVVLSL